MPITDFATAMTTNRTVMSHLLLALFNEGYLMMSAQAGTLCAAMTAADVDELLHAIERALAACGLIATESEGEPMTIFWAGLSVGAIYTLVALGYNIPLAQTGVFNFAQGQIVVFGTFFAWFVMGDHGWPWWVAIIGGAAAGGLIAGVEELLAIRPVVAKGSHAHPGDDRRRVGRDRGGAARDVGEHHQVGELLRRQQCVQPARGAPASG